MRGAVSTAPGRRSFLRAAALAVAGSAGCVGQARRMAGDDDPDRVSLSIKTTPTDDDPYAIRITQQLADGLQAVGVGVEVVPMRNDRLLQDVLVDQSFDLYVGTHPGGVDPDLLYPLLHSRFAAEPGWSNPFGYADATTDELLERQRRRTGEARREAAAELQHRVARQQPFSVVARPDAVAAFRRGLLDRWNLTGVDSTVAYLTLGGPEGGEVARAGTGSESSDQEGTDESSPRALRIALTDRRPTRNLNPVAVAFRHRGDVTDLLYDALAVRYRGRFVPWLASSWEWDEGDDGAPTATARLREDLRWHDGRPLTAEDVAFTYRFIADTSLGRTDEPVPAFRFRGGESLVRGTEVVSPREVRFRFAPVERPIATRALTVPVLPAHVWRERNGPATVAGLDLPGGTTQALTSANMDPVGSGPLAFERAVTDQTLVLDRFEDHFAWTAGDDLPDALAGEPAFDRLRFSVVPSDGAALELMNTGDLDATGRSLHARVVPEALRADDLRVVVRPSRSFYHVGFNTRSGPLADPAFRRTVARLIDRRRIVDDVFLGYASPAASPLAGTTWLPPELEWSRGDPVVPFLGEDGNVDVASARRAFREAGYRFDESGRLLRGRRSPWD